MTCSDCGVQFERRSPRGPAPRFCEGCRVARGRLHSLVSQRLYRKNHPDRTKASHERWVAANPEKFEAYRLRAAAHAKAHPEMHRAKYRASRDAVRANWRKRQYGVDAETYEAMLEAQGHVCAICHGPERQRTSDGRLKPLGVDHDHETGAVRGLLCHACNVGLGHLNDDPALLETAAAYLRAALRRADLRIVEA